jgi:hypothetical protein
MACRVCGIEPARRRAVPDLAGDPRIHHRLLAALERSGGAAVGDFRSESLPTPGRVEK